MSSSSTALLISGFANISNSTNANISIATIAPRWVSVLSGWQQLKTPEKERLLFDLEEGKGIVSEIF